MRSALTALAFLALLLLLALRYYPTGGAPEASASGAVLTPLCGRDVLRCASGLDPQPWFVVYGDSVSRGLFFDIAELIEASPGGRAGCAALGSGQPHPGHSANYSDNCVLFERRPPTLRSKCAAFEFVAALPSRRRRRLHRVSALRSLAFVQPNATAGPYRPLSPPPRKRGEVMRLGFRLKAFAWEAGFDEPWLRALADEAAALPDAIVLSFGLWDMQYPQQATHTPLTHALARHARTARPRPLSAPPGRAGPPGTRKRARDRHLATPPRGEERAALSNRRPPSLPGRQQQRRQRRRARGRLRRGAADLPLPPRRRHRHGPRSAVCAPRAEEAEAALALGGGDRLSRAARMEGSAATAASPPPHAPPPRHRRPASPAHTPAHTALRARANAGRTSLTPWRGGFAGQASALEPLARLQRRGGAAAAPRRRLGARHVHREQRPPRGLSRRRAASPTSSEPPPLDHGRPPRVAGVHYPGAVSRSHAQRLLRQLLPGCRRAEGSRES